MQPNEDLKSSTFMCSCNNYLRYFFIFMLDKCPVTMLLSNLMIWGLGTQICCRKAQIAADGRAVSPGVCGVSAEVESVSAVLGVTEEGTNCL